MSAPPRTARLCSISSLVLDNVACRTGIVYLFPPPALEGSKNGYQLVSPPLWGTMASDGTFVLGGDGALEELVKGALKTRPALRYALVREDVWGLLSDFGSKVVGLMPKKHREISEREIMEVLLKWPARGKSRHHVPRLIQDQVRAGKVEATEELARTITDTARVEAAMVELKEVWEPMPPIQGWTDELDIIHTEDCLDTHTKSQWSLNKLRGEYYEGLVRLCAAQLHLSRIRSQARKTNSEVLSELYGLVGEGSTDLALDLLFEEVDGLLSAGKFDQCNSLLIALDPGRLDTNLCVGVLSATRRAREHLSFRVGLVRLIRGRLRELAPDRAERLLENLT